MLSIRIHPAADAFMRGVHFGTVARATRNTVRVTDSLGRGTVTIHPRNVLPHEDGDTLNWIVYLPHEGAVDETFSPEYDDALEFARKLHGPDAWIVLDAS